MPTYAYRREDGSVFELEQRITESPLTTCPTTGQAVQRIITGGAGLIFKGDGFYLTDYARKGSGSSAAAPPASSDSSTSTSGDTASAKKETKTTTSSEAA